MSDAPKGKIELADASGPVSPRYAFETRITIEATDAGAHAVGRHRDARGKKNDERTLTREEWRALVDAFVAAIPLGTTLDLVGDKRGRKGVSFNRAVATIGGESARLEYLPSHVDEDDGDERAVAVVERIRAVFGY